MTKETEQSVDDIIAEQDALELDAATPEKSKPAGGLASPVPLVRPKRTGLAKAARPTSAKSLASDTERIAAEIKSERTCEKVEGMAAQGNYSSAFQTLPEDEADFCELQEDLKKLKKDDVQKILSGEVRPFDDIGVWRPEREDPDVLILGGAVLVRGGSTWFISTAGTGKSTHCMGFIYSCAGGVRFSGLTPSREMLVWYIQSEDAERRLAQDRADALAELAEQHPEVDWQSARRRVKYVEIKGKVGAKFLNRLRKLLEAARRADELPDVIFINPFTAFVGGQLTDGAFVTPFLRGGQINHVETVGLQAILEEYRVGVVIYHHTPKPPPAKEINSWLTSAFPEYQGAGSADITNWGRTFFTMMRRPGRPDELFITAGKNGGELGWPEVGGARRYFIAYSKQKGIDGNGRHAWRELDDDERTEIVAYLEGLTRTKKSAETPKDEKVGNIAPYVIRALDETREQTLEIDSEFHGMTQSAIWQKVKLLIEADGKVSFGRDKLIELIDALPPDICGHVGDSPVYYGTKDDLEFHRRRGK